MNDRKKIIFTGGGTLGSVTPLLAVAAVIRRADPRTDLVWIGTGSGPESRLVREAGMEFQAVSSGKFRRYLSGENFLDLFRILRGFGEAWILLGRLRAGVVVSAGGFVAVPVVWAAALRRIPVHIHQMDIGPGLANRLSAPFAASVSVALQKSLADFPRQHPVWTGNPVRPELFTGSAEEARRLFGLVAGVPTVLILGGGTGATGLNSLVRAAVPALTPACQIIHLTGKGKATGEVAADRYHEIEFLTGEIRHAYAVADLVVTRAGMGALTELAALGKPTIIVPMPASHQEDNAAFYGREAGVPVVDERQVGPDGFAAQILMLLRSRERLASIGQSLARLNDPAAAAKLADLILKLLRRRSGAFL
ncbi:MAG: UDP-N-acetylglucosamine--N-acetylmuramyl-(pentapeptide) pyrophosphoryl-undecaprenol N-acetylglucosamine transferase [Patescibacteria group bacterium]|jgi:UDP-N-acetylglucosamine--N-acetylmuramyl-(pentapeptide) pyrophosphoryl-undecaprenol N-acetylglucosamine transferase